MLKYNFFVQNNLFLSLTKHLYLIPSKHLIDEQVNTENFISICTVWLEIITWRAFFTIPFWTRSLFIASANYNSKHT